MARLAGWAALGAAGALLACVTLTPAVGLRPLTVMSGSMAPVIHTGDVVVTERIAPTQANAGDVVTFRDPAGSGRLITHRVQSMDATATAVRFVTKGDANNTTEQWQVARSGSISRVVYRIPAVGHPLQAARSRAGRLALVALPTLILAVVTFRWALRPDRTPAEVAA